MYIPNRTGSSFAASSLRQWKTHMPPPVLEVGKHMAMQLVDGHAQCRVKTKIAMPLNFNEPLSMTQRLMEDLEYSSLLDEAAACTDPMEQLAHVVA